MDLTNNDEIIDLFQSFNHQNPVNFQCNNQDTSYLINALINNQKELEKKLELKTKEIQNLKEVTEKQQKEIAKLQEEYKQIQSNKQTNQILDSQSIRNLNVIENIENINGNKVMKVAMKFYILKEINIQKVSPENLQNFIDEYKRINDSNHPSILHLFCIFFNDEKIPPSILFEYCQMNLEQAIKNMIFSDTQLVCLIYQIAEGMAFIHSKKIIHRNLKPSNILVLNDGTIKISDFSISYLMSIKDQISSRGLDAQKFMAPELINGDEYDEKVDVFSFGVIVHFILSGGQIPSFDQKDNIIIQSKLKLLAKQMIEGCCCKEPESRPSFAIICDTLEKYNFEIVSLNQQELQSVSTFINQYKLKIPNHSH